MAINTRTVIYYNISINIGFYYNSCKYFIKILIKRRPLYFTSFVYCRSRSWGVIKNKNVIVIEFNPTYFVALSVYKQNIISDF